VRLKLILMCVFLIGCSHNLMKERVEFTEKIISNPDKFQEILESSDFACNNKEKYYNFNFIDNVKKFEYKYLKDEITIIGRREAITGRSLNNSDTVHFIVYSGKNNEEITFKFKLINGIWCLQKIYNYNFIDLHIDY
jgi:hypothetical protein